ncbi:MAG: aminotransferase class I/II-fold pyridoxal phosphate-dependent enzyme [Candidatus Binataceae bacterium]
MSPDVEAIAYLPPLYHPEQEPGQLRIDPSWAYVPPVRPDFILNLDREETTTYGGITPAEADSRRRAEFPIQSPNRYPSRLIEATLGRRIAADLRLSEENVLLGNGIMNIMTYLYEAYSTPLGSVVVPSPSFWPAYTYAMQRGRGIWMPLYDHLKHDRLHPTFSFPVQPTRSALRNGPGICYLCNPNNPTGTLLQPDVIESLITEFPKVLFIVDEAYGPFAANQTDRDTFELPGSVNLIRQGYSNLVVARTFSKAYAMANFRVGYIISDRNNILTTRAYMGPYDMDELSVALAYYNYINDTYMRATVRDVVANKEVYQKLLESYGVPHYGGYRNSILVASLPLGEAYERHGIAVRSMIYQSAIPNPVAHTFRITIPADEENMHFLTEVTHQILGKRN